MDYRIPRRSYGQLAESYGRRVSKLDDGRRHDHRDHLHHVCSHPIHSDVHHDDRLMDNPNLWGMLVACLVILGLLALALYWRRKARQSTPLRPKKAKISDASEDGLLDAI
ncbi:hypothetical protein RvY_16474 [Ramazzottius varieornatus]|uniref:Uncharacterized protein n=1 Tax=Ramazzottius varieornatus TaxID=947166 RepID=A0A1D1W2X8_RAMVA|nr:hypothetical protein RvY_16474 [Ramazzottius varieornatus]